MGHLVPGREYRFSVISARGRIARILLESGIRLTATLSEAVTTGRTYVGRAVTTSSLRIASPSSEAAVTRPSVPVELGLPDSAASRAVIRAFVASGLPLFAHTLQRALRRVETDSSRLSLSERARLAALLEDRGLTDEQSWATMSSLLGDDSGGEREPQNRDEDRKKDSRQLEHALTRSIRFTRSGDHPLQFFNHVRGGSDHWIVIPFSVENQRGTIRLKVMPASTDEPVKRIEFSAAVIEVRSVRNRTVFGLEKQNETMTLRFVSGDPLPASSMDALKDRLGRLGIRTQLDALRAIREDGEFDGFSTGEEPDILPRTDRRV